MRDPNLDPTTRRMADLLEGWGPLNDRRSIFLGCYIRMTANMLEAVDRSRFQDGPWVTGLLHRFAGYYFDAVSAYDARSDSISAVWRHAQEAAVEHNAGVLQNLLLGINAHINYDLALAIVDVLDPVWATLDPPMRRMRYEDHCYVNRIIAETVDSVQDEVVERYEPSLDIIDKLGGPLDEFVASWLISRWRDEIWDQAERLLEAAPGPERAAIAAEVERSAMRRAHLVFRHEDD